MVGAALGIRAADAAPSEQVRLVRAGAHVALVVEHLTDRDATGEQLLAGGLDVGDDQIQALGGTGRRRGDVLAEDHRGAGARRRELEDAEVVTLDELGVMPPAELAVELLGAIDIRNRDDDDFELHVDRLRLWDDCSFAANLSDGVHVCFLWVESSVWKAMGSRAVEALVRHDVHFSSTKSGFPLSAK